MSTFTWITISITTLLSWLGSIGHPTGTWNSSSPSLPWTAVDYIPIEDTTATRFDANRTASVIPTTEAPVQNSNTHANTESQLALSSETGLVKTALRGANTVEEEHLDADVEEAVVCEDVIREDAVGTNPVDTQREQLRTKLELCLARYYIKHVDASRLRPWSIMHGILAYGQDSQIVCHGLKVNAVEYLCHNGLGNDRQLMYLDRGRLRVRKGQGFQGHDGQFLAILAQSNVPIDQRIVVEGKSFTVLDLVELEKANCRAGEELTFTLIGLSHYLDSDSTWRSSDGQRWSIPRLIHEEITQPINGAACGGAHRLMGLSYAVRMRHQQEKPISGQWLRAANFIHEYHRYVASLQNEDGSFSTDWFEAKSEDQDPRRRMYTTGHILEWLAYSLPTDRLTEPRLMQAVEYLADLLLAESSPSRSLTGTDVGPKCHAIRALRLYESRVFGTPSNHRQLEQQSPARIASLEQVFEIQRQHGDRATVHGDNERTPARLRNRLFGRR